MPKPTCTVPECPQVSATRGYCMMHYTRLIRTGSTGDASPQRVKGRKGCAVADCPNPHAAKGYCKSHYKNLRETGAPVAKGRGYWAGGLSGRWSDSPAYGTIHSRLKRHRGSARHQQCECGAPARQWSYDHTDPNESWEIVGGYSLPYSTDMDRYDPLCTFCHRRRDLEHSIRRRPDEQGNVICE